MSETIIRAILSAIPLAIVVMAIVLTRKYSQ
jgi:hypothetical protein